MSSPSTLCPQPDLDISGVGVRISFYCQVFLYAILSLFCNRAVSEDAKEEDAKSALSTLILTNVAMQITAFITSLKKEISLPEGFVVIYLLSLSSLCILISLPPLRDSRMHNNQQSDAGNQQQNKVNAQDITSPGIERGVTASDHPRAIARVPEQQNENPATDPNLENVDMDRNKSQNLVHIFAVLQSYITSAYGSFLVFSTGSFGSHPECNSRANLALYACIPTTGAGLTLAQLAVISIVIVKTVLLYFDFFPMEIPAALKSNSKKTPVTLKSTSKNETNRYQNAVKFCFILVVWVFFVTNTEILISCNNLGGHGPAEWDFGQILPMLLLFNPLLDVAGSIWNLPWTLRLRGKLRNSCHWPSKYKLLEWDARKDRVHST